MNPRQHTISIAIAAAVFALISLPPAAGRCHTFPRQSEPKAGATLDGPPSAVRVWFDADLEPAFSRMVIADAGGNSVDRGDSRVDPADPRLIEVTLKPLAAGVYTVRWNVVSRDGHRTNGDFAFTVK